MPSIAIIIPAAGSSSRFGGGRNKLLESLAGRPVIARTVATFLARADVVRIVIPTRMEGEVRAVLAGDSRIRYCAGGETRAHSVLNALRQVGGEVEWVAVHDGARPLVSQGLIDRTLATAMRHGAAVPAMAVGLTIKEAAGPLPAKVERTVPRERLWAMQTPQIARREELLRAFENCPVPLSVVTDDVQLVELAGGEVWLVAGEERNLKITTPMDLRVAEMWVEEAVGE
jgi:2-C-methyl-D-erythritol 4-phosphate cytidylyltransferase